MQAGRRLPGAEAHARHALAARAGRLQRHARDRCRSRRSARRQARDLDLQALERASRRSATVPPTTPSSPSTCHGSSACAQLELDAAELRLRRSAGKRNSKCGANHSARSGSPCAARGRRRRRRNRAQTKCGSMKRSCSAVPQRTSGLAIGLLPEPGDQRAQQQLLREAHPRVRRHLEGAELDQAEPAGRAVGRVQLVDADLGAMRVAGDVDQQVAEDPVDQPGRQVAVAAVGDLREARSRARRAVVARLVDARRLAGRADEQAGEQVATATGGSASR